MELTNTPATDAGPAVEVRDLRCRYGRFEAVRGIDLTAPRGELLAILGTNGAGKTTTLDVLEGLRAADSGRVRVLGRDPWRQRRHVAARTGLVFQQSALPDDLTPAETLRLWHRVAPAARPHRPVDEQLTRVGLTHRRDVRAGRLSGGERRRLELALALSADPELVFLDEPTGGLDPESRQRTWELLRQLLRGGTTIVLTTHHLEEAEALADRVALLHEGQVRVAGTVDEVSSRGESRITCDLDPAAEPPRDRLAGRATSRLDAGAQRLEVTTSDAAADLDALLAWSREADVALRRLQVSRGSLADAFHAIAPAPEDERNPA